MTRSHISFVIPVRNDAARLGRCLESIRRNRHGDQVEIIVVDDGSTDDSASVARRAGARVLRPGRPTVAALRNAGARAARGDLLAFVDADHVLDPGWIAAAVDAFGAADIGAAGAPYEAPSDGTWVQRAYDGLRQRSAHPSPTGWLPSGNLAVRATVFRQIEGFDERLATCEDVDLCQRVRARGYEVIHDPRLRSTHLGDPPSLAALFRGELWRGRDNVRVSIGSKVTWRDLPSLAIPLLDLLLLVVAAGGIATLTPAGSQIALAATALIVLFALLRTGVMAGRRGRLSAAAGVQTFAVALVYDAARALALVAPASHTVRRRS